MASEEDSSSMMEEDSVCQSPPRNARRLFDVSLSPFEAPLSRKRSPTESSPHSFRTLDGRFVHSKNPFSSPVSAHSSVSYAAASTNAPALPTSFESSPHALPPRPDCSPIPEDEPSKVRRLDSTQDVVAALHVQTQFASSCSATTEHDEISPTDVLHFPATPMKQRRSPFFQQQQQSSSPTNNSRFANDFDIIGELGKGSFGTVYKVLSRLDGCMYAIKAAHRQAKGVSDRDRMLKEVYALATLSDQADTATFHIVRYHQAWMEDDRLYIQTELCSGTLADERFVPLPRRYKLIRELCLALQFLHHHDMVHLDIKPENIFLKNDQFKLGDFGLVTQNTAGVDVEEGDSRYMSRELLAGDHSDLTKSDIFSLGATVYEICLGRPLPMNGPEWQDMRSDRLDPLPGTSPELVRLIQWMMKAQASDRPTAQQLLEHPQLLSNEQKALQAEKSKVRQANMELVRFQKLSSSPPPRKGLTRANTWNGSTTLKYL